MARQLTLGACLVLLACGSTKRGEPQGTGDGGAGPSADGGAGATAATGGRDADTTVQLSLDVVQSRAFYAWEPSAGAHVRIDGADTSLEATSDEAGHVVARVAPDSGPWDVTVALAGFDVISVLGVTESLSRPIHLSRSTPMDASSEERRTVSGAIVGRSWPGSVLDVSGPGLPSVSWKVGSHSLRLWPPPEPAPLRLLATEWDSHDDDATPLNAVWLDIPAKGDEPVDIVLPSPPRKVARSQHVLELPSTGPVVGADVVLSAPYVTRVEDGYGYKVGRSQLEPTEDENRFTWSVAAFTGDLAPNRVSAILESVLTDGQSREILADLEPSTEESVRVPAAESLETTGATLDELEVGWSASAYTHAGASIRAREGFGGWFIYTFAGNESELRPWPRLPDSVTREEVGLAADDFRVNVFAVTEQGVPWDWQGLSHERAVVVSTRVPPQAYVPPPPTGPLNAYDGIYSLTDVTLSSGACTEGPSIYHESFPSYFVVVGTFGRLMVGSCSDVENCRAVANGYWDDQWVPGQWSEQSTFPGAAEADERYSSDAGDDAICSDETLRVTRATATNAALSFRVESVDVPSHPPDAEGICTFELSRAAAEGIDCSKVEVYSGAFYEALY